MNLWDFTAYLSQNNAPVVDLDVDETEAEFAAVTQIANELASEVSL